MIKLIIATDAIPFLSFVHCYLMQVIQGNTDRDNIVVRWLTHMFTAQYVRIHPETWNTAVCMRIEVYGCQCCKYLQVITTVWS